MENDSEIILYADLDENGNFISFFRIEAHHTKTLTASLEDVTYKIHSLEFPPSSHIPERKKMVDWLYIDADEEHVALQFREKKGDPTKAENGVKK